MFDFGAIANAKNIFSGEGSALQKVGQGAELLGEASEMAQAQQAQNANPENAGEAKAQLESTPAAQNLKKVASAIAAYYTGGLSSLAQNVGMGLLSEKNPNAANAAGVAQGLFGGGK